MALPTFLTAAELLALNEHLIKARTELNMVASLLKAGSELNLLPEVQKASGLLYKATNKISVTAQKRIGGN